MSQHNRLITKNKPGVCPLIDKSSSPLEHLLDPEGAALVEQGPVGLPLKAGDVEEDPGAGCVVNEGPVLADDDDVAHVGPGCRLKAAHLDQDVGDKVPLVVQLTRRPVVK